MTIKMPPHEVADAFVEQYYAILNKRPEELHRFYKDSSLLGWPENDDVMTPVTTLDEIKDKILSSNYKNCSVEVKTVDAQASHDGGVIVAVTGSFIDKDDAINNIFHTFFLATQERGFFVLNDILRVTVVAPILKSPEAGNISDSPTKASDENEKIKKALDPEDCCAKHSSPASSASVEKVLPAVVTPASHNVPSKITYASMVAKEACLTPPTTPKTTPKASAPLANGAPKAPTNGSFVPKALASPTKIATKLPTGGNSTSDATNPRANDRRVYVGRLPYNITKHGIVEVLRKFGPVRRYSDAVQIRKYEDGFCCGFVEFESADSARRAVETHHVKIGDNEAYIAYKKSSYNRGGSRSPTRDGFRNGSENRPDYETGRARGSERSPSSGQVEKQASRDRLH